MVADLPSSAFWRFSLELYARPGVATACLALQDGHDVDVNLVLLALWLGKSGHRLNSTAGATLARLARSWQRPIVRPLRQVRRRLKRRNAAAPPPWPEAMEHWRSRLAEVELALEQVEQLILEQAAEVTDIGPPDAAIARDNMFTLGLAAVMTSEEIQHLLALTFAGTAG